jgi:hypothetical protein
LSPGTCLDRFLKLVMASRFRPASSSRRSQFASAVRKDPDYDQDVFSFLPGITSNLDSDQAGRSVLAAPRLWITGLCRALARLTESTAS